MNDAAFLAAIRDEPDDDLPRLAFADWLEEHGRSERAELIRAQVELSHGVRDAGVSAGLLRRQRELLAEHRAEWLGPLRKLAPGSVFERGFVCHVSMPAEKFLAEARKVLAAHPVTRLHLTYVEVLHLNRLAKCPQLEGMTSLDFLSIRPGDEAGLALGGCPHLGRLRELVLHGSTIQPRGVRALAASPYLNNLASLDLAANEFGDAGVAALTEAVGLPKLSRLDLAGNGVGSAGAAALAACPKLAGLNVLRLAYNRLTRDDVERLARSPHLANVRVFDVTANGLDPDDLRGLEVGAGRQLLV
jgi:uncharacterized protein (TIGR02996 family)